MEAQAQTDHSKIAEVAEEYFRLRQQKEELERQIKEINAKKSQTEVELMKEMEFHELKSYPWKHGTFSKKENFSAKIVDKTAMWEWLNENMTHEDVEGLRTIHSRTLSSFCKDRLADGDEVPDGIQVSTYEKISFRRS